LTFKSEVKNYGYRQGEGGFSDWPPVAKIWPIHVLIAALAAYYPSFDASMLNGLLVGWLVDSYTVSAAELAAMPG
jgi:hypothetical protein